MRGLESSFKKLFIGFAITIGACFTTSTNSITFCCNAAISVSAARENFACASCPLSAPGGHKHEPV
jgi:hypothetical protein